MSQIARYCLAVAVASMVSGCVRKPTFDGTWYMVQKKGKTQLHVVMTNVTENTMNIESVFIVPGTPDSQVLHRLPGARGVDCRRQEDGLGQQVDVQSPRRLPPGRVAVFRVDLASAEQCWIPGELCIRTEGSEESLSVRITGSLPAALPHFWEESCTLGQFPSPPTASPDSGMPNARDQ